MDSDNYNRIFVRKSQTVVVDEKIPVIQPKAEANQATNALQLSVGAKQEKIIVKALKSSLTDSSSYTEGTTDKTYHVCTADTVGIIEITQIVNTTYTELCVGNLDNMGTNKSASKIVNADKENNQMLDILQVMYVV